MNIYQRINEVRKKVHYAKKDKAVQGYMAVTHDAVTAIVRNHLIEHGIIVVPRLMESEVVGIGTTKSGAPMIRYQARYEVDLVNMDDPQDKVTVSAEAHANDTGDKAPGKATSYATKYTLLKVFSIETGEDEEGRVEPYASTQPITADQAAQVRKGIEEAGADEAKFLRFLAAQGKTTINSVEEIPAKMLPDALAAIEAKRKKAA